MRAKTLQIFTSELQARYPGIIIFGKGDKAHEQRVSDHNEDDTVGVRAAQSDSDSVPEHRAIDAMLGNVFTRVEALWVINDVIAQERPKPVSQRKLRYFNFENLQYHSRNNYEPRDNSDDPHPTHLHCTSEAAQDDNTTPWLTATTKQGGSIMFCQQVGTTPVLGIVPVPGTAAVLQRELNIVLSYMGVTELLTVDDSYGKKTADAMMRTGVGNPANNGSIYWEGEYSTLQAKLRDIAAAKAIENHLSEKNHGSAELPESISFIIPAQTITAPLTEEE